MQVGTAIVVRKRSVVLQVAVISSIGTVQRGDGINGIASAIVARIGCSLQETRFLILESRMGIIIRMLLAKGGHNFLVLSGFGCLVDPFFPR